MLNESRTTQGAQPLELLHCFDQFRHDSKLLESAHDDAWFRKGSAVCRRTDGDRSDEQLIDGQGFDPKSVSELEQELREAWQALRHQEAPCSG